MEREGGERGEEGRRMKTERAKGERRERNRETENRRGVRRDEAYQMLLN